MLPWELDLFFFVQPLSSLPCSNLEASSTQGSFLAPEGEQFPKQETDAEFGFTSVCDPPSALRILPCPLFPFLASGYSSFLVAEEEATT